MAENLRGDEKAKSAEAGTSTSHTFADQYKMPIYVFQTGDSYHAVSNEAQGVGRLVDTLAPQEPFELGRGIAYTLVASG